MKAGTPSHTSNAELRGDQLCWGRLETEARQPGRAAVGILWSLGETWFPEALCTPRAGVLVRKGEQSTKCQGMPLRAANQPRRPPSPRRHPSRASESETP